MSQDIDLLTLPDLSVDRQDVLVNVGALKALLRGASNIEAALIEASTRMQLHHRKRGGGYAVIGKLRVQTDRSITDMEELVLYQSNDDGSLWGRAQSEIDDGRFNQFVPDRETPESLRTASLTVGGGHVVFGSMEALGRVQTLILMDSNHPVEESDTRRSLQKRLDATEAEVERLTNMLRENAKIMAGT